MYISDSKKFVYIVIPKCASETIRGTLLPFRTDTIKRKKSIGVGHHTYSEALNTIKEKMNYLKFTFIRNPYDRIYSAFLYEKGKNFSRYLEATKKLAPAFKGEFIYKIRKPMYLFSHVDGKCMMDFIGCTEKLSEDFKTLASSLNIQYDGLKNKNIKSKIPENGTYVYKHLKNYTKEDIQIVNEIHKKDFEIFGYPMYTPENYKEHINDIVPLPKLRGFLK